MSAHIHGTTCFIYSHPWWSSAVHYVPFRYQPFSFCYLLVQISECRQHYSLEQSIYSLHFGRKIYSLRFSYVMAFAEMSAFYSNYAFVIFFLSINRIIFIVHCHVTPLLFTSKHKKSISRKCNFFNLSKNSLSPPKTMRLHIVFLYNSKCTVVLYFLYVAIYPNTAPHCGNMKKSLILFPSTSLFSVSPNVNFRLVTLNLYIIVTACIELWFLLHFSFMQSALHRTSYWPKLTELLTSLGFGEYEKVRTDMYQILLPYMDAAIANRVGGGD